MNDKKEQFLLFRIRVFKDKKAFDQIYDHYFPSIIRFLTRKLPTIEDADDATSITFHRLWNYLCSSKVDSLSGLLFTIARNAVAEYYRKNRIETVSFDQNIGLENRATDEGRAMHEMQSIGDRMYLAKQLSMFSEYDQQLIHWRYQDDLPIKEIAKRLDKTETSVRVALHRAIKKLRENISHD